MRAHHGADAVVGVFDFGDPGTHGLVDRILQRAASRGGGDDSRSEQAHPVDVELLALDVDFAHVDGAGHAEQRGCGCGGDTVLAGTGFGDQVRLAHALREECLANHVIDLVAARVVEVFTLEHQPEAEVLAEVDAVGEW